MRHLLEMYIYSTLMLLERIGGVMIICGGKMELVNSPIEILLRRRPTIK